MTIKTQVRNDVKIVHLAGEFGAGDDAAFAEAVTDLLDTHGSRIVVDLSAVPYINSAALGALVRLVAQANVQEGRVLLAAPTPFVTGVLQTTRLDKFFEVAESVEAALKRIGAAA
jgi:anti-anti-sigma factor